MNLISPNLIRLCEDEGSRQHQITINRLKMKKVSMLLLLLLLGAVIICNYAQIQHPATVIRAQGCPADGDRQAALNQIRADVQDLLNNHTLFCNGTGWNRIAFLDMSNPTTRCPGTWRETNVNSAVRACGGVRLGDRVCDSNIFPNTNRITYNQVCGRMVGYQLSAPDAFRSYYRRSVTTIEGPYLDGVSLTHGRAGSRQHIWSFAVGESETSSTVASCPCNAGSPVSSPPFVGNDYFCESGVSVENCTRVYFGDDPLWDGMNCDPSNTCCEFNRPPYFTKILPSSTNNDLEVRLCSYDEGCVSDVAVSFIDLYVR